MDRKQEDTCVACYSHLQTIFQEEDTESREEVDLSKVHAIMCVCLQEPVYEQFPINVFVSQVQVFLGV